MTARTPRCSKRYPIDRRVLDPVDIAVFGGKESKLRMKVFRSLCLCSSTVLVAVLIYGAADPINARTTPVRVQGSKSPSSKPGSSAPSGSMPPLRSTTKSTTASPNANVYSRKYVRAVMERVSDWQVANPVAINDKNGNLWARAAFYAGIMDAYRSTGDKKYLQQATRWAESREWKLGDRPRHADDQAPAQTYLGLYLLKKDPTRIADTKTTFDAMLNSPRPGREDWWWCDALFMAPPGLARMYAATGDEKYLNFLNTISWDTTNFLFDPETTLSYRDTD